MILSPGTVLRFPANRGNILYLFNYGTHFSCGVALGTILFGINRDDLALPL